MATDNTLPFELNSDALAEWLDGLSLLPHAQAAHQLNLVLKQLKDDKYPPIELLPLLVNLTPLTLHFSNSLSATAATETDLSGKSLKIGKLAMQLPRQLALIFCQSIESKKLESTSQNLAIFYALQLIGYAMRCYSLFYDVPSATLWKKSAQLYKLAASTEALKLPQATKLSEFKPQTDIESVVKRNLLFNIICPGLYKPDEISQLFLLSNQCAHLLKIETSTEALDCGFYWDLSKDLPPYPVRRNNRSLPTHFMGIKSQRISHELQLGTVATKLSPSHQNKLALLFGGYKQVFSAITPGMPSRTKLIPGFLGACHYLQELNKLSKINQLSAQLRDPTNFNRGLALVPLEHQRNVFEQPEQPFSGEIALGKYVNLHKTPNKSYWVAESRMPDCSTGDIVLLYKEQHPVSIAIIRQQNFNELSNAIQLLLEQISGNCTIYSIADNGNEASAVVIGEGTDNAQVFLANGKYALNSKIPLTIGSSLRLTACMESNPFFARFRFALE
ncbi:MAG: hypothetical protein M0R33_19275 [Methylomonas sp.]|jgi:hypothetical protein|uniref:hypothetical protein n=1 Tax=Methylomonas sp. TaxID=418 RepID=UPI0025ED942F|nr:hypothetical protein [Methylomonas sp.]MCK9608589.1 hypothetical protein [Methylomonas sp.]